MYNRKYTCRTAVEGVERSGERVGAQQAEGGFTVEPGQGSPRGRPIGVQGLQGRQVLRLLQEEKHHHHWR